MTKIVTASKVQLHQADHEHHHVLQVNLHDQQLDTGSPSPNYLLQYSLAALFFLRPFICDLVELNLELIELVIYPQ